MGEAVPRYNMTILVIDDSETDRIVLQEIFKDKYHVHLCESAEEGLAYLQYSGSKVRLILVDNMMEGMSGLEFLRYCRHDSALAAIPKVMITANDTQEDQIEAFREGAYDYITKPFVQEIIAARVGHIMEISRRSSVFDSVELEYTKKSELDASTSLLNKMSFKSLVVRILESLPDDKEALMVLDIDNFKEINDRYGHLTGDAVINCVAGEMVGVFRKTDILGRFGGDEFVVLMTRLPNVEVAKRKAVELMKNITLSCSKLLNVSVSVSIGLSHSERGDTVETLFGRADQALYEAKNNGKSQVVVYGERVPPIVDDDKPIVLVCGEDPQLYPAIALAFGEGAAFASITSYKELASAFEHYRERIRVICMDTAKKVMEDSDEFYRYILEQGGGERVPILAVCREGNMEQLREAMQLRVKDVLTLPPQMEVIQRRLSRALINAAATSGEMRQTAPQLQGESK
ncbi:MAG: diguanylate cyclase [Oscillospiraceae bacterium]|nr:diguanylate cyclase [Oscillospiraceae bacterium]